MTSSGLTSVPATSSVNEDEDVLDFEKMIQDLRTKSDLKRRRVEDDILADYRRSCAALYATLQASFESAESQLAQRYREKASRMADITREKREIESAVEGLVKDLQAEIDAAEVFRQTLATTLYMDVPV